jgi:hypothetical protein
MDAAVITKSSPTIAPASSWGVMDGMAEALSMRHQRTNAHDRQGANTEETHALAVFYGAQGSEQTGAERQPTAHHPG